jgi:uncharacterized protein YbjT (DUF2867 family)
MKVVVIGGTGLIGSKVVQRLAEQGHQAVAAAPSTGVDTITGQGLAQALAGADVVVDVANSPSFADDAVLAFFQTAGANLHAAEVAAGVGHLIALTIVGADRLPDSGYLRAKVAQEQVVQTGDVPYTIIRATQFFEFLLSIADSVTEGGTVRATTAKFQPIAAQDVADIVAEVALSEPVNGIIEIAGPAAAGLDTLLRAVLAQDGDGRIVVGDPHARYFGTELQDSSLTGGPNARLAPTTFADWLSHNRK